MRWIGLVVGCAACGRGFFNPMPADASGGSDTRASGPPIAYVQTQNTSTDNNLLKMSFPAAEIAGNANVVVVSWIGANLTTVVDDMNNSYDTALGPTSGVTDLTEAVYYATNIAGGFESVEVSFNTTPSYVHGAIYEYENLDSVDNATGLFGSSGVQAAAGELHLTSDGDLVLAAISNDANSSAMIAGYTLRTITPTLLVEDTQAPTSGDYLVATSETESGAWTAVAVGFRRKN